MKYKWHIVAFAIGFISVQVFVQVAKKHAYIEPPIIATSVIKSNPQPNDWELFKQALIEVESGGESSAVGSKNDLGVLQITPIYVEEVNRLTGWNRYAHSDALDPQKSLEMFEVMQGKYNPIRSLKKALILHNPNAMNKHTMSYYEYKVMYNFYKLKCEWYERD